MIIGIILTIVICVLHFCIWYETSRKPWGIQINPVWETQIDSRFILDVRYVSIEKRSMLLLSGENILAIVDPINGSVVGSLRTKNGSAFGFLAIADINGDGRDDIITTIFNASTCYWYSLKDSEASSEVVAIDIETLRVIWRTNISISHPSAIIPTVMDFDGDGKGEVLLEDIYSTLYLVDNDGSIIWKRRILNETAKYTIPRSVTVGDVDGDGKVEAVVIGNRSVALITLATGKTIWRVVLEKSPLQKTHISRPILVDLNNNGDLEIVCVSTSGVYVISPKGNIIWQREHVGGSGLFYSFGVGDLDSDGELDIAVIGGYPDVRIYLYRGFDGEILGVYRIASRTQCGRIDCIVYPEAYHKLFICDLDGDKLLDVLLFDWLSEDVFLGARYRNKQPSYYSVVDFKNRNFSTCWLGPNVNLNEIRLVYDLNGDGFLEIIDLHSSYSSPTKIRMLRIGGSGSLTYNVDNIQNTNNILYIDKDMDLLPNTFEQSIGTNQHEWDTDGDTLPDGWEYMNNLNPRNKSDASADYDEDGINNFIEYEHRGDPWDGDTDDDGLSDYDEVQMGTDLRLNDTDGDGYSDGYEVSHGADPLDPNDYPTTFTRKYWWILIFPFVIVILVVFFLRRKISWKR